MHSTVNIGSWAPENVKRYIKNSYNPCKASNAKSMKKLMYPSYLLKNALVL
jgi:hypothetical protein